MNARSRFKPPSRGVDILLRPERVEAVLWRKHIRKPCSETRQKLFEHYRPLAEKLANRQFTRRKAGNFDRSDVQQLGYEALIKAIERFDPKQGVPFAAYAPIRIKGHISNGLAKVSEASAQRSYRQRLERERLRSLGDGINSDNDPLAALSDLSVTIALGLLLESDLSEDVEAIIDPAPSAYESLAWNELIHRIHHLIDALPEREAYVMRHHYRNGVHFQQIAELLGVSKGRISQIHRAALLRLRSLLAKHI